MIQKTIYFYQISWTNHSEKTVFKDKLFFHTFFEKILIKEDNKDYLTRLEEKKNINNHFKSEDEDDDKWIFGILSKTKKNDFPLKQNIDDGFLSSLDLKDNEGLYYPTHFAIYDGSILITELNFDSLRPNFFIQRKINEILKKNNYDVKEILIKPILRNDIEAILNSDLREIQLSIAPNKHQILKEDSYLKSMFNNIESFPDLTLNIGLTMGKRRSSKFYKEFDAIKQSLLNLFKQGKLNEFDKISLKRKNEEKTESINLLDQIFKTTDEFIRSNEKNRSIDSEDAFNKFKLIYKKIS